MPSNLPEQQARRKTWPNKHIEIARGFEQRDFRAASRLASPVARRQRGTDALLNHVVTSRPSPPCDEISSDIKRYACMRREAGITASPPRAPP
jgi:hypothetical protein